MVVEKIWKKNIKALTAVNIIGFILVLMAGWVDTVGVCFFLNENSSFLTGRAAKLGKYILSGDILKVRDILFIIISFIMGSYISTLITKKTGLTGGLVFTGALIILTALTALPVTSATGVNYANIAFITIPLCMGSQNAATSLTAINRTTHLTGPATDIGINMAKGNWDLVIFWVLRWVGFFIGTFTAFKLIRVFEIRGLDSSYISYILLIPGIAIILTAIIQKVVVDIPLLEE